MIRIIIISLSVLLMSACGQAPPVPTDYFYKLTLPQGEIEKKNITDKVIYISGFNAEGLYNERALLYINDNDGRQLVQHHYHFWVTSPPRLLQDFLIKYLHYSTNSTMIVTGPASTDSIKISAKVLQFEYQTTGSKNSANVAIEFRVDYYGKDLPILVKQYKTEETFKGSNIEDIVAAFNQGVLNIFSQFLGDLK